MGGWGERRRTPDRANKASIGHLGLPFWESAFLPSGQNCEADDTCSLIKAGMKTTHFYALFGTGAGTPNDI
jgi:hypothetical protein